jgi:hypothetical protein
VVLACQGLNIWGVIQPDTSELRNAMSSLSLIFDLADIAANSTLLLVNDDGSKFNCTNNPLADYYSLTKSLKILDLASTVKQLVTNQQTNASLATIPTINCMEIDSIYQKVLKLQKAFRRDTGGVIRKKLGCFKNSIVMPFNK